MFNHQVPNLLFEFLYQFFLESDPSFGCRRKLVSAPWRTGPASLPLPPPSTHAALAASGPGVSPLRSCNTKLARCVAVQRSIGLIGSVPSHVLPPFSYCCVLKVVSL